MIALALFLFVAIALTVAFVRYRRHTKAVVRPEAIDAKAIDTWECRVAVHEAGHAVAAWCCTLVAEVKIATIEDKGGGGVVKYSYVPSPNPAAPWCCAVIALAGVAAEAHVYARWKTAGAHKDITDALTYVRQSRGHAPPWERLGGKRDLGFQKMFS
ncbi:MAG TPA: hypothetical protein VFA98_01800, partial [Thermoanaerobaculia bacterium]|nr:hypothetical protein [Thermoanaerobaculia bacterium]